MVASLDLGSLFSMKGCYILMRPARNMVQNYGLFTLHTQLVTILIYLATNVLECIRLLQLKREREKHLISTQTFFLVLFDFKKTRLCIF